MSPTQEVTTEVIHLLTDVLGLGAHSALQADSLLLGSVPELDSMAVINLITALEESFGITVQDDEISGATFESVATLAAYVVQKLDTLDA